MGLVALLTRFHPGRNHRRNQVFVLDAKGTTFYGLANYYARIPPKRKCIFIDPSSDRTVPIRFFNPPKNSNVSSHASRVAKVILNALGTEQIADVQRYRRMVNMVATWCAVSGQSILEASNILYFHNKHLCIQAADKLTGQMRNEFLSLANVKENQWDAQTESTRNRLSPFLTIDGLKRTFGLPYGIGIGAELASGANILVNLTPSLNFPEEACRIMGGILTSELLAFAQSRMQEPHKLYAYLDEVEMYQTPDLSSLLELSAGAGFRVTLVHHHEGQFADPRLVQTIEKNCRIKFVGAGTTIDEAKRHAIQSGIQDLNQRKKKDDRIVFKTEYELVDYQIVTTHPDGGVSVAEGTRPEAHMEEAVIGQEDYTLDEKILQAAEQYVTLQDRQFRIITPDTDTLFTTPLVVDYLKDRNQVVKFMETHSVPNDAIDDQLKRSEEHAPNVKKPPNARSKKRPSDF